MKRDGRRRRKSTPEARARSASPASGVAAVAPRIGPWSWFDTAAAAGLFLATLGVYFSATRLGFLNLDDTTYVLENPWIRAFSAENLGHVLTKPYFANFSPVHLLSYMVDYAIGGLDPAVYHWSNNLWAAAVGALVYCTARALTANRWAALVAGALFVVHPVHVEAVAWVSIRKDLVAAAFALASFLAYLERWKARRPWIWDTVAVIAFLFGVAAKTSVVVLPAILWLHDVLVGRRPWLRSALHKVPYAIAAAIIALQVASAQPDTRQEFSLANFGKATAEFLWLLTGFGNYVLYHEWTPAKPGTISYWGWMALPLLLGALIVAGFRWRGRAVGGTVVLLAAWALISIVPSQILSFMHPVCDRYLFFPSVASSILVGWAAASLGQRLSGVRRWLVVAATIAFAGFLCAKTLAYLSEWRDPRSVWFSVTKRTASNEAFEYLASYYQSVADDLSNKNEGGSRTAAALAPEFWKDDARLSALMAELSRSEWTGEATKAYGEALRNEASRNFGIALARPDPRLRPNLWFRKAKLAADRGDLDTARADFERALTIARNHSSRDTRVEYDLRCNQALGVLAWKRADWPTCLLHFRAVEKGQREYGTIIMADVATWIAKAEARQSAASR